MPGRRKKSIFCALLDAAILLLSMIALVLRLSGIVTSDTAALMPGLMAPALCLSLFIENATLPGGWRLEFRKLLEE